MNSYIVDRGDPRRDRAEILVLGQRLPELLTEERYAKYYSDNPLGPPRFMLARSREGGEPIGMAALFPVILRIAGTPVLGAIAGDLVVHPAHRTLGPALLLQRALLAELGRSDFQFAYGMPNRAAQPVFRRIGYTELGHVTRFVKLLKTEFALREYLRTPQFAKASAKVLDAAIAATSRERWRRRRGPLVVEPAAAFDDRFRHLWNVQFERSAVMGERTTELLNWKYELTPSLPSGRFGVIAARDGETIRGYAVSVDRKGIRHVLDLVFESRTVLDALLSELTRKARSAGISALAVDHFGPRSLLTMRLRTFGFFRRTARPLVVFTPGGSSVAQVVQQDGWYLLGGDEDV